jgi:hypothetical protein
MFRRRRPNREIHFSFDSFLDVVANVVGIILRLILVAWVGARSYKAFVPVQPPTELTAEEEEALAEPKDPLSPEIEKQRKELARVQALLLEQIHKVDLEDQEVALTRKELEVTQKRKNELAAQRAVLAGAADAKSGNRKPLALTLEELREHGRQVAQEIETLSKAPSPKQALRYHTPVSAPVQSEEWMFECRAGRVTLVDIGTLLEDAIRRARSQMDRLRDRWELSDVTDPIGPFRLRFVVERERGLAGELGGGPSRVGSFRATMSQWEVEPVTSPRGEAVEAALKPASEFRRVVDHLDSRQATVTLWVYPDSFPLYRQLRDYLHEHDIVVAGRPVPDGSLIAASRSGSASRGQ